MLNAGTFITFILCTLAFYGAGRRILKWCKLTPDNPLEDWVLSSTLGIIAVANLVMALGFVHLLHPAAFWTLLLLLIILDLSLIKNFIIRCISRESYTGFLQFQFWEKTLLLLMLIYMLIRFINTFAPPVTWDATTQHYLVPAMYLKAGYIYNLPHVIFSYYPSLVEMLYLFGMGLQYDVLASHTGWYFGPLMVGTVYIFSTRFLTPRIGLVAGAIILSLDGIGVQMDGGYVDLPQALFCTLSIYMLFRWRVSASKLDFIFAALFFSASLATKHLGYALLPPVIIYIGYVLFREKGARIFPVFKAILIFALIALVLPLPWYIRAYILRGNPFFPFPVFGFPTLRYPPLELDTWFNPGFKKNIISLITYIYYLTTSFDVQDTLGRRFTPYFLAGLPFFWVAFRRGVYTPKVLFWICFYCMGFAFIASPVQTRYMLFFIPLLALLAADIISTLFLKGDKKHTVITWIVVLLLFLPLVTRTIETCGYMLDHTAKVIMGFTDHNAYLMRESPRNWGAISWMNSHLPPDALVLCIEPRTYRLDRKWITWLGLEDEKIPQTPADNVYLWKKYGFTHVWLGDDATVRTLLYYNIVHLPGDNDIVTFKVQDLWTNFFGVPFTNGVSTAHVREYWMPRELGIAGFELYENGQRVTDADGNPLFRASRSAIESDVLKKIQINFMSSIRELVESGGLHIVYPPPAGKSNEELTFVLSTDYETYREVHEDVRAIGDE